jgi:PAS domain S-box-containing protein
MGELIARHDWAATAVGPIEKWSAAMRTTVGTMLRSAVPIVTLWRDDGVMLYNDAYSGFAGDRHPQLLGAKVREGWPEVAAFNDNVMRVCFTGGGTLAYRDQELTLDRTGTPEPAWMNLDYSPILSEDGVPEGVMAIVVETTAKVRAERRLNNEHARLSAMFQQAPGFMAMLSGPRHIITAANQAYFDLIGRSNVVGSPVAEAVPEAVAQGYVTLLDDLYASGRSYAGVAESFEVLGTASRPASAKFVDFVFQPIRDDAGAVVGIFVQGSDVTDRVSAQQTVLASEARFRTWAQAMPHQVWSADAAGQLDWFNDQVYAYSGAQRGALHGEAWAAIVYPQDVALAAERWRTCVVAGSTYEIEFRIRRADGAYRWHLVRALPISGSDGQVLSWIGTNTDIEDQKASALKLERLNATLAEQVSERTAERDRMWRLSTEIMLVSDFEANLTAVNPAFTTLLGWPASEVLGTSFMELVHPDDRTGTLDQLSALGAGNTTFRFENRYRRKDGGYSVLSWSAVPDQGYVHAVARDVTLERATTEAMKQAEKALQQSQKMDAIGKLTGGIAHDFNNLLQVISGNLQLLALVPSAHERVPQWVANAIAGVERGAKLASSLLAFGRRQALEPEVVRIGRVVHGMEHLLRHALGEPIDIETIVSGGLWPTLVDVTQVETAILNLAINARDAMAGPGKLTIEVGNAYLDEPYCRTHAEVEPGQYVMLAVSDTGAGMPPEVLAHAFEPFFSTKPEGKGTGLGLSMVYGFVKQSGGHVKIYSEVGHGTTVKIYLPRSFEAEAVKQPVVLAEPLGGSETILVVEDDDGVRAVVVEMLSGLGYRVLKAADASAALTVLESGIAVDLLFTDVVMPGALRSPELARTARTLLPQIAVLFTSGYTENAIVHGGRLDPGVELLGKPYSRDALARKIRQVLAGAFKQSGPAAGLPAACPPAAGTGGAAGQRQPMRILLVEDEEEVREVTGDMLRLLGKQVQAVASGAAALAALEEGKFDVLITDQGLPDMQGTLVAERGRQLHPCMRIVIASGKAPAGATAADALLLKPYDLTRLLAALGDA